MKFIKWTIVLLLWVAMYVLPATVVFFTSDNWYECIIAFYVAGVVYFTTEKTVKKFGFWFDSKLK